MPFRGHREAIRILQRTEERFDLAPFDGKGDIRFRLPGQDRRRCEPPDVPKGDFSREGIGPDDDAWDEVSFLVQRGNAHVVFLDAKG